MKILFTGFYFDYYSGSQMHICEMASYLSSSGHDVTIASPRINKEIKEDLTKKDVKLVNIKGIAGNEEYDILFLYHFPLLAYLLKKNIKFKKLVNGILSSFIFLERPLEIPNVSFYTCVSKEVISLLKQNKQISNDKIFYLPNFIPLEYTNKNLNLKSEIKKIAIISNHVPKELEDLAKKLPDIQIDIYGKKFCILKVTPEILENYDVIISIGKTVQYSLGLGLPIYEYDHFGGCGYITLDNIDNEEAYNFSGRATRRQISSEDIAKEILQGYKKATFESHKLQQIAFDKFLISKKIDNLMKEIKHLPDFDMNTIHLYSLLIDTSEQFANNMLQIDNKNKNIAELSESEKYLKEENKQLTYSFIKKRKRLKIKAKIYQRALIMILVLYIITISYLIFIN